MNNTGKYGIAIFLLIVMAASPMGQALSEPGGGADCIRSGSADNSTNPPSNIPTDCAGVTTAKSHPVIGTTITPTVLPSSRIIFMDGAVLRGKTLAVEKPSPDFLQHTVRIWKFDENVSVSTQSATEMFSQAPAGNGSSVVLMTPEETNAIAGNNLTIVMEFPSETEMYDISYDRHTGTVSDSGTHNILFSMNAEPSGTGEQNLAAFMEAINNERARDRYLIYRITVVDPFIQVDPIRNLSAGSLLRVTGTTNLPAGEHLKGRLRPSSLHSSFHRLLADIFVIEGTGGINTWSCTLDTKKTGNAEFFFTIDPDDNEIKTYGYSRLFTLFENENASEILSGFEFDGGSTTGSFQQCNISDPQCLATSRDSIWLTAHYNRIVLGYIPATINITNAVFKRECNWDRYSRPRSVDTIPATIHRFNNHTVLLDPAEPLCFTGFGSGTPFCNDCGYTLDWECSYPNPKLYSPDDDAYYSYYFGYLWKDDVDIATGFGTPVENQGATVFGPEEGLNISQMVTVSPPEDSATVRTALERPGLHLSGH